MIFRLHQRPVATLLEVPHAEEANHYSNPVKVVRDDGAIGRRVSPAEDRIEDAPATSAVDLWTAAINVPDALTNVIRAWTGTGLGSVATNDVVPCIHLKVPDGLREEA